MADSKSNKPADAKSRDRRGRTSAGGKRKDDPLDHKDFKMVPVTNLGAPSATKKRLSATGKNATVANLSVPVVGTAKKRRV